MELLCIGGVFLLGFSGLAKVRHFLLRDAVVKVQTFQKSSTPVLNATSYNHALETPGRLLPTRVVQLDPLAVNSSSLLPADLAYATQ